MLFWHSPRSLTNVWSYRVQILLKMGKQAVETQHVLQEPLEDWFDEDGHAVLVGDAVHVLNVSSLDRF